MSSSYGSRRIGLILIKNKVFAGGMGMMAGWSGRKRDDVYRLPEQWGGKSE